MLKNTPLLMPAFKLALLTGSATVLLNGCVVVAVADAVVSVGAAVVSTTAKVGSAVVGTTVDVARAGIKAATSDPEPVPVPVPPAK